MREMLVNKSLRMKQVTLEGKARERKYLLHTVL